MSVLGIIDAMRSSYPPAVRLVWQCLENHANGHRFWAMTDNDIATELGLGLSTVARAVDILTTDNIIRVNRCKRRKTVFWMVRTYPAAGSNGAHHPDELTPQNESSSAETEVLAAVVDPPKQGLNSELTPQNESSSAELTLQNEDSVYPPVRIHPRKSPPGDAREARRRPVALPERWAPSAREVALGIACGLSRAEIDTEAEQMRDWAAAGGKTCVDWDARFRNWLRREAKDHRRRPAARNVYDQIQEELGVRSLLLPPLADEDEPHLPFRVLQ